MKFWLVQTNLDDIYALLCMKCMKTVLKQKVDLWCCLPMKVSFIGKERRGEGKNGSEPDQLWQPPDL